MKTQFSDLIESCPMAPGIYKMFGADGTLLYVGKARNINTRLKQYLDISKLETHKQIMRSLVTRIEWETTPDEATALILEEKLIKSQKPKYNIMLTDGKMYPQLALTQHEFPRLLKFRGKISQKRDVFGPYPSVSALNETIKTIQKVCGLRTCTDGFMNNRTRPCLLYQIGRCSAPCMYHPPLEGGSKCQGHFGVGYEQNVKLARRILTGDVNPVIEKLSTDMKKYSDNMDYESAANMRDKIAALTQTSIRGIRKSQIPSPQSQILSDWLGIKINRAAVFDNSHLFGKTPVGAMIVFGPDGFIKSDYRHFKLRDNKRAGNDIAMMAEFIERAIAKNKLDLIIVDGGRAQWNIAKKTAPGIPILGVTKGEKRDGDESFILPNGKTVHHSRITNHESRITLLLRAVRDEAHRFAISFHRARHAKTLIASQLDEIEGIGPARKRAVLHHFGSVRAIADASMPALLRVPNLGKSAAEKIYNYFH